MNGQPSPYSHSSSVSKDELSRDARRFLTILALSRMEIAEMSPEARQVWDRLVRGGWYTEDLVAGIDKLIKIEDHCKERGGYAGAQQE